jgi:hypothetical protein
MVSVSNNITQDVIMKWLVLRDMAARKHDKRESGKFMRFAWGILSMSRCHVHPAPSPKNFFLDFIKVGNLPLKLYDDSMKSKRNTIVDTFTVPRDSLSILEIRGFMLQGNYMSLPGLLRPKANVCTPYRMELLLLDTANPNEVQVVKHFKFDEKILPEHFLSVCQGSASIIDWGGNNRGGPQAFCFMLDQLGGEQFRHWGFNKELNDKMATKEDIDKGIDFILAEAPRSNADLMQKRWVMHQMVDQDSPIYGWRHGDIRECLAQIKVTTVQATKIKYLPIAWGDLSPWFRKVVC